MLERIKNWARFSVYRAHRWFEINLGWFFVNGSKQEEWHNYLQNKYQENERDHS